MDVLEKSKWKLLLNSIEFFKSFSDDELEELIGLCEVRKYSMHDFIVKEDKKAISFYVVLKGKASIIKINTLKQKRKIAELKGGDCFGEMAVLLEETRSASIMASGECFIFEINAEQINELKMETQVKLYKQFAIVLAGRLKNSSSVVADTLYEPAE